MKDNPVAIVTALAACENPIDSEYSNCVLCNGEIFDSNHKPECPWRRARAYIASLKVPE